MKVEFIFKDQHSPDIETEKLFASELETFFNNNTNKDARQALIYGNFSTKTITLNGVSYWTTGYIDINDKSCVIEVKVLNIQPSRIQQIFKAKDHALQYNVGIL